jgi:hypothetical protein
LTPCLSFSHAASDGPAVAPLSPSSSLPRCAFVATSGHHPRVRAASRFPITRPPPRRGATQGDEPVTLGRKDARHRRPHSGDARSRETLNRIRRTTPSLTVAPAWLLITGNPPSAGPSPPRSVRSPWPRPQSRAWPGNRKKGSARTTWTEPRPRQAATTAPRWARLRSQQAA